MIVFASEDASRKGVQMSSICQVYLCTLLKAGVDNDLAGGYG